MSKVHDGTEDFVRPAHWSFTAKKLAKCVEEIIAQRRIGEDSIPRSLYLDANELFKHLSDYIRNEVPHNPPLAAGIYLLATENLRNAKLCARPEEKARLSLYCDFFLKELPQAQSLDEKKLAAAREFLGFLVQLYEWGQSDRYNQRMVESHRGMDLAVVD